MVLSRFIDRIGEMPVVKFWVRFSAAGPAVLAGAIAYNIIFALVPGAVVLLTAASFFGKTAEAQAETVRVISLIAPVEVAEFIGSALGDTSRIVDNREGVVIILGAVLALWFGTRGVLTIMRVLTRVEGIEDDRPWWETRLIATGLTIAVGLALALASVLVVAGRAIRDWLQEITQLAWPVDLWAALRIPVASLSVLGFFWLLYRFAPPRRLPGTWPAAFMATGGMIGFSLGLQHYLNSAGGLGATYATFGAVALLLLWLYVVSYLIIVAGSLAAANARRRERRRSGDLTDTSEQMRLGLETLEQEVVIPRRADPR
jgi:membrane protein